MGMGTADGIGDAARAFLQQRLDDTERRMTAAPVGSVARAEAAEETREIRRILEADRDSVSRLVPVMAEPAERPHLRGAQACPACGTDRIGSFRFCRSCGHDFEAPGANVGPSVLDTLGGPRRVRAIGSDSSRATESIGEGGEEPTVSTGSPDARRVSAA